MPEAPQKGTQGDSGKVPPEHGPAQQGALCKGLRAVQHCCAHKEEDKHGKAREGRACMRANTQRHSACTQLTHLPMHAIAWIWRT